jgi:transposase InsO family protein
MGWSVETVMDQRVKFVHEACDGGYPISELCQEYGISRQTGYKWLRRYREGGINGLGDRARRPRVSPRRIPDVLRDKILTLRMKTGWGARKVLQVLGKRDPNLELPVKSTVCEMFLREGLVKRRRRRPPRGPHPGRPAGIPTSPNQLWTADFKGQFRTRDRLYCYPLTIADYASRYVLSIHALPSTKTCFAMPVFERAFREYGLPEAILTDNGAPFASASLARLSELSVYFLKLDIAIQLIQPGHPEQNGVHERMHRSLKERCQVAPAANLRAQHRAFAEFRKEFNEVRPHEALNDATPASRYERSPRSYPEPIATFDYPSHWEVRRVSRNSGFRWKSRWISLSSLLATEYVALEPIDDAIWNVYFRRFLIARFHERTGVISGLPMPIAKLR